MTEPLQNEPAAPRPRPLLFRRLRGSAFLLLLFSIVLALAYYGIDCLLNAFRPGVFLDNRIYDTFEALALLAVPATILWTMLVKHLSNSRWNKTLEERKQQVKQEQVKQCATRRSKMSRPSWWSWVLYCLKWANYKSHQPDTPTFQRIAAYSVLLLGLLGYVATFLLPLVCVGAAFADDNTLVNSCFFLALALLCTIIPWLMTRSLLRYKRTHPHMRTQPEEMQGIRDRHTQWHAQENQKPLRSKVITTVIILGVLAFYWLRVTVFHAHHPHEDWTEPAMYTPFALYAIFVQFRKPTQRQSKIHAE